MRDPDRVGVAFWRGAIFVFALSASIMWVSLLAHYRDLMYVPDREACAALSAPSPCDGGLRLSRWRAAVFGSVLLGPLMLLWLSALGRMRKSRM